MTLPFAPLSLPAITSTVSPFLIFMSEHLRGEGDDLHEPLVAQLAPDRAEDAGPPRLAVLLDEHGGVLVEPDVGAIRPPALGGRQRAGLHQPDAVADAGRVGLVVRLDLARPADDLRVQRVLHAVLELDHDGLVHLVGHDQALTDLALPAGLLSRFAHAAPSSSLGAAERPSSRSRMIV